MRENAKIKVKRKNYLRSKAVLNYCFIAFFTFIFSLQQFSVFANTQSIESFAQQRGGKIHPRHLIINAQVAPHRPVRKAFMEPEAELAEEVETKLSIIRYWNQFAERHLSGELFYTSFLRSQFLKITSSIHNRTPIPIFILNRSWKSFLS